MIGEAMDVGLLAVRDNRLVKLQSCAYTLKIEQKKRVSSLNDY